MEAALAVPSADHWMLQVVRGWSNVLVLVLELVPLCLNQELNVLNLVLVMVPRYLTPSRTPARSLLCLVCQ